MSKARSRLGLRLVVECPDDTLSEEVTKDMLEILIREAQPRNIPISYLVAHDHTHIFIPWAPEPGQPFRTPPISEFCIICNVERHTAPAYYAMRSVKQPDGSYTSEPSPDPILLSVNMPCLKDRWIRWQRWIEYERHSGIVRARRLRAWGHEIGNFHCEKCWWWGTPHKCNCGGVIHRYDKFVYWGTSEMGYCYACDSCDSQYVL